ncbi:GNAT family N-acetyltransferase [Altererythrobacter xixiisoli]|uniref:GNAT family N-acetyltransferase n=1 Tax=Croceibacterium xixiisoli TaxID=1476466 RepID=A0A6I4TQI2_9SPHN|nr:GNAT family N-acetyltransferase [Croceibacterium xixiisoli]MXO97410.1 GNAT family N-acetyltransferase [Croceibacterium xixiisoli]
MSDFRLETKRLVLRDWQDSDWNAFFRHTNTPAVMRWLGGVLDGYDREEQQERIEGYARDHGHTFWVVERQWDGGHLQGQLIGFCGLKRSNQPGAPIGDFEIGWRLREDAWGRGYAREAAQASMRAGFETFGAPHMIALTVERNDASWGLMERLGMERRPDLDFASDEFDPKAGIIIAYAITRPQWEATHG